MALTTSNAKLVTNMDHQAETTLIQKNVVGAVFALAAILLKK